MAKEVRKVFTSSYRADHSINSEKVATMQLHCWDERRRPSDILLVVNVEDLEFDYVDERHDGLTFVIYKGSQLHYVGD